MRISIERLKSYMNKGERVVYCLTDADLEQDIEFYAKGKVNLPLSDIQMNRLAKILGNYLDESLHEGISEVIEVFLEEEG